MRYGNEKDKVSYFGGFFYPVGWGGVGHAETLPVNEDSHFGSTQFSTDTTYEGSGSEIIYYDQDSGTKDNYIKINGGATLTFKDLQAVNLTADAKDGENVWSSGVRVAPDGTDPSHLVFQNVKNVNLGTAADSADYFWSVYVNRGSATFDGGEGNDGTFAIYNNGQNPQDEDNGLQGYGIYNAVQTWDKPNVTSSVWTSQTTIKNYKNVEIHTLSTGIASSLMSQSPDGTEYNNASVTIENVGTVNISSKNAQGVAAYDRIQKGSVGVSIKAKDDVKIHSDTSVSVLINKYTEEGSGTLDITSESGAIQVTTDSTKYAAVSILKKTDTANNTAKNAAMTFNADKIDIASAAENAIGIDQNGSLTLASASKDSQGVTTINGGVSAASGELNLTNQAVDLQRGNFVVGTVNADQEGNSSLTFHTTQENGVSVDNVTGKLNLVAGANITEGAGSAEEALKKVQNTILGGNAKETLQNSVVGGEGGDMLSAWTVNSDGTISYANGEAQSNTLVATKHLNAATLSQWRYEINHLSDRLGEVRGNRTQIGSWARIYGADTKVSDTVSTEVKMNSVQVGSDVAVGNNWILGGAFSYTNGDASFINGSADTDMYSLAVYGTGYFDCGAYVDVIGRIGRISTDTELYSQSKFSGSYDNTAFGLSAEVGYQWNLSKTFYVTPQAQLSYGYVKGDDFDGGNGIRISQDNFQTFVGRLGTQAGANFAEGKGKIYLTASVNHDFQGDTEATATKAGAMDQTLKEDLGTTWFSYGVGFQYDTDKNFNIYGSLTKANGSDYQDDYRYSVGVRYNW